MSENTAAVKEPGEIEVKLEIPPELQLPVPKALHSFTLETEQCSLTISPRNRFVARFLQALVGIEWRVKQ